MKTIAIHSHKGGVGKTTVALLLAKYAAVLAKKVCVADFDFIGSGMTDLFALEKPPRHYLDHYFRETNPYNFDIEQLLGQYSDRDMGAQELLVMCNLGDGLPDQKHDTSYAELRSDMGDMVANEPRYREIQSKTVVLQKKFEKDGIDLLIIDCHPGLSLVSETVRPLASLNVYLTTPNRSDCLGLLSSLNVKQLDGPQSFLVFNMAEPPLIDTRSFRELVESDTLVVTEGRALFSQLECIGHSDEHFAAVPESELLRHLLYLGRSAKLPPISPTSPEFSFCAKILALV